MFSCVHQTYLNVIQITTDPFVISTDTNEIHMGLELSSPFLPQITFIKYLKRDALTVNSLCMNRLQSHCFSHLAIFDESDLRCRLSQNYNIYSSKPKAGEGKTFV